ncbi:MAG: hypothetical protein KGL13_02980 [Gammaproteobacteria bacterium]|nr:hypothetical protein [Gammaproteobacteria bacterium]MDE2345412.1 hypothetical protein [Gammaproteobacteria bacterium]
MWFWLLLSLAAALIVMLAALIVWRRMSSGQRRIFAIFRNISDRWLHHVVLPDGVGGQIAIDVLLLRDNKLYLLMLRDADGAIFAAEKMDQWTAIGRHRRFNFRNPMYLLQDQVLALRALVPELIIVPRIIFVRHARFPKGRPDCVELLEEFVKPLSRPKNTAVTPLDARLEIIWTNLQETAGVPLGKETPTTSR